MCVCVMGCRHYEDLHASAHMTWVISGDLSPDINDDYCAWGTGWGGAGGLPLGHIYRWFVSYRTDHLYGGECALKQNDGENVSWSPASL